MDEWVSVYDNMNENTQKYNIYVKIIKNLFKLVYII